MAFSRAAHSRLLPRDGTAACRGPASSEGREGLLPRDGTAACRGPASEGREGGVSQAWQFINEYEARKALVSESNEASERNARPASRPKRHHKEAAAHSPPRNVTKSRSVERTRVAAPAATSRRPRSRPRSSSAHRSKPASSPPHAPFAAPQAITVPRSSAAAYTSLVESRSHARELEKEVDKLRRELKAVSLGRLEDAARRDELESSRTGSMQATISKLRVQLDASKHREEQIKKTLAKLQKERGTISDKEAENSALRAQLADVRALAETDRRAAKATQNSLESRLRDLTLKQSYRNSPDKHGELSSAVNRRRVERDAETIVKHNRRRSLDQPVLAVDDVNGASIAAGDDALGTQIIEHDTKTSNDVDGCGTDPAGTILTETVDANPHDTIDEEEVARVAAERDDAQQQLANLSKVCKVLEAKVANQDKRIRQLGEATAAAERTAQMASKERELMAIKKERLAFQLQRYRKKERQTELTRPDPSACDSAEHGTSSLFHGVSDKVRTMAEELAKQLDDARRQNLAEYKETAAAQQQTILKQNRKIAQLRVELGEKAVELKDSPKGSPKRRKQTNRADVRRSPARDSAAGQTANAVLGNKTATGIPSTPVRQDEAQQVGIHSIEMDNKLADSDVIQGGGLLSKDAENDTNGEVIDPELWASSVATALAFRAFQNGVQASRAESPVLQLKEVQPQPAPEPEPEPEPVPEQDISRTSLVTSSPGERLFKFATGSPTSYDKLDSESDESVQHWDIDVTSANSVSFLGATLREGRSPPRPSPVQMCDEGRMPRVGANSIFGVATGSI